MCVLEFMCIYTTNSEQIFEKIIFILYKQIYRIEKNAILTAILYK